MRASFSVPTQKGNVTIPPAEQIVCQEIAAEEQTDSDAINVNPVFDLYSSEIFDPSTESFEELLAHSNAVDEEE